MTIDFRVPSKVTIRMDEHTKEIVDEARPSMSGTATSPAADHSFDANPNPTHLDEETSHHFHTMMAKLLFLSKRARPDLQEAVA